MRSPTLLARARAARNVLLLALLPGLAGCVDPAHSWQRAGVTDARRDADYADCRNESRSLSNAGIAQDIAATRAGQGFHTGATSDLPADTVTADLRDADQALDACMTDKGYQPR